MADHSFNGDAVPFVPREEVEGHQQVEEAQPPAVSHHTPLTSADVLEALDPGDDDLTISVTLCITQVNAVRRTNNGIEICSALASCADGQSLQITGWRNLAARVSRELMNNHIMTIHFLRCSSIAKGLNNGQFVHKVCLSAATTITDHGAQVEVEQVPLINLNFVGVTMGKFSELSISSYVAHYNVCFKNTWIRLECFTSSWPATHRFDR
ncbi:hypothetical protein M3Y98_00554600 [Aphelenchoides besseyi]|nr:hypothetical protein M3Y98_00554600 [Aphelenchoides besseyi]